jgi:hypothetical protein
MPYNCPRCDEESETAAIFRKHLERKNICQPILSDIKIEDIIIEECKTDSECVCEYCEKVCSNKYNLEKHKKLCKKNTNFKEQVKEKDGKIKKLEKEAKEKDEKIKKLEKEELKNKANQKKMRENEELTREIQLNVITKLVNDKNKLLNSNDTEKERKINEIYIQIEQILNFTPLLDMEYIYLLRTREFKNINVPVYKIGKSKSKNCKERIQDYAAGYELCLIRCCKNCDNCENQIKKLFNEKYILETGFEYFKGDFRKMIKDINNIIDDEIADSPNFPDIIVE